MAKVFCVPCFIIAFLLTCYVHHSCLTLAKQDNQLFLMNFKGHPFLILLTGFAFSSEYLNSNLFLFFSLPTSKCYTSCFEQMHEYQVRLSLFVKSCLLLDDIMGTIDSFLFSFLIWFVMTWTPSILFPLFCWATKARHISYSIESA